MNSMKAKVPRKATREEEAYIRDLAGKSAFEKLDRGEAQIVKSEELPEPLKKLIRRVRTTVHIQLPPPARRRLEALSRANGVPADELARRWVEEALAREAG